MWLLEPEKKESFNALTNSQVTVIKKKTDRTRVSLNCVQCFKSAIRHWLNR